MLFIERYRERLAQENPIGTMDTIRGRKVIFDIRKNANQRSVRIISDTTAFTIDDNTDGNLSTVSLLTLVGGSGHKGLTIIDNGKDLCIRQHTFTHKLWNPYRHATALYAGGIYSGEDGTLKDVEVGYQKFLESAYHPVAHYDPQNMSSDFNTDWRKSLFLDPEAEVAFIDNPDTEVVKVLLRNGPVENTVSFPLARLNKELESTENVLEITKMQCIRELENIGDDRLYISQDY